MNWHATFPQNASACTYAAGNWTADESVALSGDYAPLIDTLNRVHVGTLFLEMCTGRAGDSAILRGLDEDKRIAVGVANQKLGFGGIGRRSQPPDR